MMKLLLPFVVCVFAVPAFANSFSAETSASSPTGSSICSHLNQPDSTGCASSSSTRFSFSGVSASAGNLFATMDAQGYCHTNNDCYSAGGSASFSVDFTFGGPAGESALVGFEIRRIGQGWFSSTYSVVGAPLHDYYGTNYLPRYSFTYGQTFTVSGHIEGGCSECDPQHGSVFLVNPFTFYDMAGVQMDTPATMPLTSSVPEPSTLLLAGVGLLGLAIRAISKAKGPHPEVGA